MKIRKDKGLTFDDVLLIPKRSPVTSRQDVETESALTASISLQVPILSANMDTVTEATMAIAMARIGGIGILHRFMTIEQQVRQVKQVKRAEGIVVDNPHTIAADASIAQARQLMRRYDIGGLVLTATGKDMAEGASGQPMIGLVTQRDVLLAPDDQQSVRTVMTKPEAMVTSGPNTTLD
ncbi:MAG: IMP dehydrogenase, partial [Caldilineaceae bacterium]|nr:IMP dehydrogenase [Caldilineaceae bacterium]